MPALCNKEAAVLGLPTQAIHQSRSTDKLDVFVYYAMYDSAASGPLATKQQKVRFLRV